MKRYSKSKIIITLFVFLSFCFTFAYSVINSGKLNLYSPFSDSTPDRIYPYISSNDDISTFKTIDTSDNMKALWVSFYSLQTKDKTEAAFKSNFNKIVSDSVDKGINTLIVHIRPFCDALYKSKYFPVSHIITGTQGDTLSFDPLEYMIEVCHKNGLAFHGWINPYRVSASTEPKELSKDNPAVKWAETDYVIEWNGYTYLNPAYSEVRKLIIDGVREVVENYDVDGIHFDDYFYPTTEKDFDSTAYNKYLDKISEDSAESTLMKWRTANVSLLVSGTYSAIHSIRDDVVFGISPQGNIDNALNAGADVYSWGSISGYVDYLCPQIYTNFENTILPFDKAVDNWKQLVTNKDVSLFIGIGLYKANSDADDGTWKNDDTIIGKEIDYVKKAGINGFALFSYDYLNEYQSSPVQ